MVSFQGIQQKKNLYRIFELLDKTYSPLFVSLF
nr:MAG TPA: hypothetical protein [Caudoviricetes sp.]